MDNQFQKRYGLFTAICLVVGIVIGSGVFFKAEKVLIDNGGSIPMSLLTVISVGMLMLVCSYAFSLLASRYERVGGFVDYAEGTCGEVYAYFTAWFSSTVYFPVIASTLAWISARYIISMIDPPAVNSIYTYLLAILIIVAIIGINVVSPKLSGIMQVSTTVIKLIPLAVMAAAGIFIGMKNGNLNMTAIETASSGAGSGFFGATVAFAFAYDGWIVATCINAELKNSKRNLPIALVTGAIIVITVYLLYFIGISGVLSTEQIMNAGGDLPRIAFTSLFGGNALFGSLAYVFIIISCLGTTNGIIMATCRGFYSIAVRNQGPIPSKINRLSKKANMPVLSAIIGLCLTLFWLSQRQFCTIDKLLPPMFCFSNDELPIITLYASYIPIFIRAMCICKDLKPFNRFVIPSVAIIACAFMMYAAIVSYKIEVIYYLAVFAVIMLIGLLFYRDKAGKTAIDRLRKK